MDSRAISIVLAVNFLIFSTATAFNITKLLGRFSDYGNLNDLLTRTNLAEEINSRSTITILALDNGAVSGLSSQPIDVARRILSVHVVLDYYDSPKLKKMATDNTSVLTTLFQASGGAVNQQGHIKVVKDKDGEIWFSSAVRNAQVDSKFVKSVASQPYNISVIQISSPIQVPGIETRSKSPSPPPPPPRKASSPSPVESPAPSADSPAEADTPAEADAPAPAKSPKADADSPVSSPPKPNADSPTAADGGDADAPAPAPAPAPGGTGDDSGAASRGGLVGAVAAAVVAVICSFLAL